MPDPGEITIIVHNATGLKHKFGGHKFFVVFGIGETKYQTEVIKEPGGNPVWNEENTVTVNSKEDEVLFVIRQKDAVLGQVTVPVSNIYGIKGRMQKQKLQPHKKCSRPQGELTYQCFVSHYRKLDNPLPERQSKPNKGISKSRSSSNLKTNDIELENKSTHINQTDRSNKAKQTVTLNETSDSEKDKISNRVPSSPEKLDNGINHLDDTNHDTADETPRSSIASSQGINSREEKNSDSESISSAHTVNSGDAGVIQNKTKRRLSLSLFSNKRKSGKSKNVSSKANNAEEKKKERPDSGSGVSDQTEKESTRSDLTSVSSLNSHYSENENMNNERNSVSFDHSDSDLSDDEADHTSTSGEMYIESPEQCSVNIIPEKNKAITHNTFINGTVNNSLKQSENKSDVEPDIPDLKPDKDCTDLEPRPVDTDADKDTIEEKEEWKRKSDKKKKKFSLGFLSRSSHDVSKAGKSLEIFTSSVSTTDLTELSGDKNKRRSSLSLFGMNTDQVKKCPKIISCTPNQAPVDEPRRLCIEGFNLGTEKSDILSLKVAGCDCLDTIEFKTPSMIYCKTHFQFEEHTGPVEIITKSGGQGLLEDGFTFYDELAKFTPTSPKYYFTDASSTGSATSKHSPGRIDTPTVTNHPGFFNRENKSYSNKAMDDVDAHLQDKEPSDKGLRHCTSDALLSSRGKDEQFKGRTGRRSSEFIGRPRRKAPPVPDEENNNIKKAQVRGRRASESVIKLKHKGENENKITQGQLVLWKDEMERKIKKRAPPPPSHSSRGSRSTLTPLLEHDQDDAETKELTEKVKKLEEENAALEKDNGRLRGYIDGLVSRVMDRCPEALLQMDSLKTHFYL